MKNTELVCVTCDNNNKFYRQTENTDGSWTATWGRVGVTALTKVYPMDQWNKKYEEKLKKGYKDITELRVEAASKGFKDLTDKEIQKLLNTLQKFSKQSIADNYTVSSEQVTALQVEKAQEILNSLIGFLTVTTFNRGQIDRLFTELYTVLPRKMKNVRDHVLNGDGDLGKAKEILSREQDLVDNMASQVQLNKCDDAVQTTTLEAALGITMGHVTNEEIETIKKLLGEDVNRFKRAFRVTNNKTQKRFDEQKMKSHKPWTKFLWHGSRNENWLSILSKGLQIRPTGVVITGAMFGNGCYYADKARKSIGYTSVKGSFWANGNSNQGFVALYEVNTGMELRVERRESWMGTLSEKDLKVKGEYDSLFAKGGNDLRNNEYIIYNVNQCTVKYIVEIG